MKNLIKWFDGEWATKRLTESQAFVVSQFCLDNSINMISKEYEGSLHIIFPGLKINRSKYVIGYNDESDNARILLNNVSNLINE